MKTIFLFPIIIFSFVFSTSFFSIKGWIFIARLLRSILRGEFSFPQKNLFRDFPAHLHINISPRLHKKGVGSKLMKVFLEELKLREVKGVHLRLYGDENSPSYRFFQRFSFRETGRHNISFFPSGVEAKVFLITMVREV